MKRMQLSPGQRFNKLVVLEFHRIVPQGTYWKCLCDCGKTTIVTGSNLSMGKTKSCGCLHKPHGESKPGKSRLYKIWSCIQQRCEYPGHKAFPRYGGRGITICAEWRRDFPAFRFWALSHGYRDDLTIDRIDNDGNYEPGNCQWLTRAENTRKAQKEQTA